MQRTITTVFAVALVLLPLTSCKPVNKITEAELVRRTQQLFDSVAAGDQGPWREYFADDCMYFNEKGTNMDKAALLADITPLPKGFSGSIKIGKARSHIEGNVAILSYDLDEKESVFGQQMWARYHATDTWMYRHGKWQIVAGQIFRYYEDPTAAAINTTTLANYVGIYELAPGNALTISVDGKQLYLQRANNPKVPLFPEAADVFFRRGVEGRIIFRHANSSKVDALINRRNNEDVIWKKIK